MSSNNIYNILDTLKKLEPTPEQTVKETAERIYESVAAQGSVLEGVNSVEARLNEKYMGFKKTVGALKKQGGVDNPEALAASIGRKKYGKAAFQKAAAAGKKMGEGDMEEGNEFLGALAQAKAQHKDEFEVDGKRYPVKENGLQRYTGIKKYGKDGFEALQKAGREGADEEEKGRIKDKYLPKEDMSEERETLQTKKGTIYKGGKYGTEYDPSDEEKKTKTKHVPKKGQKGRPKAEKPMDAKSAPKGDIFGRTTGEVPKGKKGTKIKGKGNIDTVDEAAKWRDPEHKGKLYTQEPRSAEDDYYGDEDYYNPKPDDYPGAKRLKGGGEFDHNDPLQKGFGRRGHDVLDRGPRKGMPSRNHITSLKGSIKAAHGTHPSPVLPESRNAVRNMVLESVNFKRMMDEANMTLDEMLECMNQDIKAYKATGDMTDRLRDFMHLHNHAKKQMEEAGPVPYEVPAVQRRAAGAPPLTPQAVQQQDANRSMHPGMTKLDAPKPAINQELDELAKLAGITDEGNAFTGKLASTPKGGEFELDGKTFKDTSNLDEGTCPECHADPCECPKESTCMECGMYESMCKCNEGNLFTKHLKATPKGGEFEIDGKKYKDTSSLDEGTCAKCDCDPCECGPSTTLEDIAKLAGIAQEGRDYGDTTIATPPKYDNTPDEEVEGEDVLLKGGDGEVAGKEKRMHGDKPTFKNGDNPLAEAEFNPVEAMGRRLMRAYEAIKVAK
jgi:hypothetical protein